MKKTKAKKEQEQESGQTTRSRPATEGTVIGGGGEKRLPLGKKYEPEIIPYELPDSWQWVMLKTIDKGRKKRNIKPNDFPEETFELFSVPSFEEGAPEYAKGKEVKSGKQLVEPNDVLICKINPRINRVWLVTQKGNYRQIGSTEWIVISPNQTVNPKFLMYSCSAEYFREIIKSNVSGVGGSLTRARPKEVVNYPIPIPPLPEQHRIVSRLDALLARAAAARERLERVPDLLRQFRQSVLARAVSGELTREWRGHENNWEKAQLKNACRKIQDGAHHSPKNKYADPSEGRYMYITSKNIRNNGLDLTNVEYVDENYHQTIYPRCNPEIGDVLLTKDGVNTGNVTLNTLAKPFSLLSSVCLIKTDEQKLLPGFLMYYIQSPIGFKSITGEMTGTAIKRIVLRQIKKAEVPIPPLPEQREIVRRVEALFAIADRIEERYEQLREQVEVLPQAVLAKAFRGELVEQDAGDEPAGALLDRIRKEKDKK